jgi:hypothetical protein
MLDEDKEYQCKGSDLSGFFRRRQFKSGEVRGLHTSAYERSA